VIGQTRHPTEVVLGEVFGATFERHCQFGQVVVNSITVLLVPSPSCIELLLEAGHLVVPTSCLGVFKLVAFSYGPALNYRQMLLSRFQRTVCFGFRELDLTGVTFLAQFYEAEPALLASAAQVLGWPIGAGSAS
jgi:hypothetical protein